MKPILRTEYVAVLAGEAFRKDSIFDFRTFVGVSGLIMSLSIHGWAQTAPSDVPLAAIPAEEITNALEAAPAREGPAPETPDGVPHQQLNQNAPVILQEALLASVTALPGVRIEPTQFSLDGSKGWRLEGSVAKGPEEAFYQRQSRVRPPAPA